MALAVRVLEVAGELHDAPRVVLIVGQTQGVPDLVYGLLQATLEEARPVWIVKPRQGDYGGAPPGSGGAGSGGAGTGLGSGAARAGGSGGGSRGPVGVVAPASRSAAAEGAGGLLSAART